LFIFVVSFTDALDKAKRGLYTSDLDDIDAQTTSNRHKKSIATEKLQNKFSKPSGIVVITTPILKKKKHINEK